MGTYLGKGIKIVIYAAEPYPGGEVTYIKSLIEALLLLKDINLELYVTKESDNYFSDVSGLVSKKYVYNLNLRFGQSIINKIKRKFIKLLLFINSYFKIIKLDYLGFDLIIFPYFAVESLAINKPYIIIPHDKRAFARTKRFERFNLKINRIRLENASAIVVESNFVKNDIMLHTPQVSHKIKVLVSPPPINNIRNTEVNLAVTKQIYNLPSDFLFYPAHIIPDKNHINLIFAIKRIEVKYNEVINLVCSYMNYEMSHFNKIKALITRLSLNGKIILLEKLPYDSVKDIYRLSRALVMPTMLESLSLPIWEAFYLGCPVVSSNVCALPEQVGDAGLLFDPNDIEDMAEKIYTIWTDEDLRKKLIQKGYERVKDLTLENYAKQWEKVIEEALQKQ